MISLAINGRTHNVDAEPDTVYYLVNLLSFFSRSENLYERTAEGRHLKPLALMYPSVEMLQIAEIVE